MSMLSPDEILKAVDDHGGVNAAAKALGIPRSSFGDQYRKARRAKPIKGKSRVLVVGDLHCPVMLDAYIPFLEGMARKYQTNRTVLIGDVVDWSSISYHAKPATMSTPLQEYQKTKKQVAAVHKAFPVADVMIGNHDCLPARRIQDIGLPEVLLKDYAKLWKTPGWTWHPRYDVLEIDGVSYCHGDMGKGGQNAAMTNAKENFHSRVQGHLHSAAGVQWFCNEKVRIFAMQTGCGIDHKSAAMEYGKKFSAKPILGAGVVIDGTYALWEPMLLGGQ